MAWVRGPDVDYDSWAELVDDPWWNWKNVKEVLKIVMLLSTCPAGNIISESNCSI